VFELLGSDKDFGRDADIKDMLDCPLFGWVKATEMHNETGSGLGHGRDHIWATLTPSMAKVGVSFSHANEQGHHIMTRRSVFALLSTTPSS
jgi:hypothetical protein